MIEEDLLVAVVALGLGTLLLLVAVLHWEWFFQLPKARWLESRSSRAVVRLIYALLGAMLIAMGSVLFKRA